MPLSDALRGFALFLILLSPGAAIANDWDTLNEPGAVAIMRHALAPGTGDPAHFELGDCSTQRNLNDVGRNQAESLGEALRARGINFAAVWSSEWCRAMDTAEALGIGPVTPVPALNSFFRDPSTREAQTADLLDRLDAADGRIMMVTHFVNIRALTGQSAGSGEVLVIRRGASGIEVLGRINIAP